MLPQSHRVKLTNCPPTTVTHSTRSHSLDRKVRPMIEELARLERVQRERVRHIPIHDPIRQVIHERREIPILITVNLSAGRGAPS